jgi:hypothetical protein
MEPERPARKKMEKCGQSKIEKSGTEKLEPRHLGCYEKKILWKRSLGRSMA